MKSLAFALVLAAAPLFAGDLRVYNASEEAVAARIACNEALTPAVVAPHGFVDAAGDDCRVYAAAPLVVLRTGARDGVEWQQLDAAANDACPATAPLFLPLNGCRFGSALAAVTPVDGAAYSWSIDGGSILSGAGTERILIALEGGDTARVTAAITKAGCTTIAAGVMALRDALRIVTFDAGKGNAGEPRTATWSYANGEPATQILSGPDFAQPVVLDASARSYTFTPIIPGDHDIALQATLAQSGRSRAAGHGGGGASSCNSARASASFHVDCTRPDTNLAVPGTVGRGKAFSASVSLAQGSTATWKITNGTPAAATGESVTITPLNDDPVDVSVTVVTTGGCSATASAHVVIDLAGVCDNPTVKTVVKQNDCGGAVVEAIFTGKPPFHGTWSDGVPFLTSAFFLDRAVASGTATFSVSSFSDAYCGGAASNAVTLTVKKPTAVLSTSRVCAGSGTTVTATFTGVPPFSGRWSDGTAFSTASATLQRTVTAGGTLSMTFGDANCSGLTSPGLDLQQPGTATLSFENGKPSCFVLGSTKLDVTIAGATPPYKVTWADGFVQQSSTSPIVRYAYDSSGIYAISRVQDQLCDLTLTNAIVGAPIAPTPYFWLEAPDATTVCSGTDTAAFVPGTLPAGGALSWVVDNGTITSGQGTSRVHFLPGASGVLRVTANMTVSGCTTSYALTANIRAQVQPAQIALSPSTTKVGQPVTITVTGDTQYYTVTASVRNDLLVFQSKPSATVTVWKYTPATTGTVTILAHESGSCQYTYVDSTATISITP